MKRNPKNSKELQEKKGNLEESETEMKTKSISEEENLNEEININLNEENNFNQESSGEDDFTLSNKENDLEELKENIFPNEEDQNQNQNQEEVLLMQEEKTKKTKKTKKATKCCKIYHKMDSAFKKIKVKMIPFFISLTIFLIVLVIPVLKEHPEAHRCLAILLFVASLWATETFPLFVTALLVPVPVVWLKVLLDDNNQQMDAEQSSPQITYRYFDPVVLLFLGGFCIAQALHKYHLSEKLASIILRKAGTNPKKILFLTMMLGLFLSMWISNVASAVVCISVLYPLIKNNIPDGDPFQKALLIGIAYSNNVGGMITPIASPQNAIAVKLADEISSRTQQIGFLQWTAIAFPTALIPTLVGYFLILKFYKTKLVKIEQIPYTPEKLNYKHWIVIITTTVTVLLWCLNTFINKTIGDLGITAIIPVFVFFGTGILSKEDFGKLSWPILILMGGGLALGYAVQQSDLLQLIANGISYLVGDSWLIFIISAFSVLMVFASTFMNSTVAGAIVLPVVGQIGYSNNHMKAMLVLVDLMTSGGHCLPFSSFPNAATFAVANDKGKQYLGIKDYLMVGASFTVLSYISMTFISYNIAMSFQILKIFPFFF
ncbi:low-affinity phosphate transporter [Anaeramoeba ignava]|uniref:Low-affinity phosphate transporter n=1 Tax=Anaeramoeba ignava TaxID=1746090 RepID=A0A9Q0LAB1_ANAIG|nr:low-affinity phosphate transporter [Anaeramoeba ignava]